MIPDLVMHALPMLGPDWMDPEYLIDRFGDHALWGIITVVFIETGLLFPFLPGDSLLFTAGMLVAQESIDTPLWLLCLMLFLAAFIGDQVAYFIGEQFGHRLFKDRNAKVLNPKYLDQANEFFQKYGGRAVILARFVPFVRTYMPVAAGMAGFKYRTFISYNVIGALVWGVGITVIGYLLGNVAFVKNNIEMMLILIVFISVLPIIFEVVRARMLRNS